MLFNFVNVSKPQKLSAKPNCFWELGSRVPPLFPALVVVPIFDTEKDGDLVHDFDKLKEEENTNELQEGKSEGVCVLVIFILELILIICLLPILAEVI